LLSNKTPKFFVAVINTNNDYPNSYVCNFPINPRINKQTAKFFKIFYNKPLTFGIQLIEEALKNETDPIIKTELEKRLKIWQYVHSHQTQLLDGKKNKKARWLFGGKNAQFSAFEQKLRFGADD
jgi:hypothetical protein